MFGRWRSALRGGDGGEQGDPTRLGQSTGPVVQFQALRLPPVLPLHTWGAPTSRRVARGIRLSQRGLLSKRDGERFQGLRLTFLPRLHSIMRLHRRAHSPGAWLKTLCATQTRLRPRTWTNQVVTGPIDPRLPPLTEMT